MTPYDAQPEAASITNPKTAKRNIDRLHFRMSGEYYERLVNSPRIPRADEQNGNGFAASGETRAP